ncbi:MAG: oligoendopeptidase F [Clostridiales bacterium]|nr:oligoendopeptidase F [Clostridiales bacterium]
MNISEKRLHRSEVPVETTWDLTALFPSDEAWLEQLKKTEALFDDLLKYKNKFCENGSVVFEAMSLLETAYTQMVQLGTYSSLRQAEDGTNSKNQENSMIFATFSTGILAKITFINSEITALEDSEYNALFESEPKLKVFQLYLDDLYKEKSHMLTPESEKVLASLGEITSAPYRIYSISKAADMTFDDFADSTGKSYPNSFALYESKYEFSSDRSIRKNAYESFSGTLKEYENTFAAVYAAEVRKQIALSRLRRYSSATEMLLEPHKVSIQMYENQIKVIYNELAPHMRRFADLKKEQLGLDQMNFYDLKAPLDVEFTPSANIETIKSTILEALSILGDDYKAIIKRAFDERWIDFSDNIGKSTGAFCSSPYGAHPFILITYQDNMRSAFTLAHELGHAGHFANANKYQRIFDTRPSTYFVEAPSTINEMLLAEHLMRNTDDPRMKRWVILQLMGTYYHNFVTHLLEAEFQRRIYEMSESGVSLTAKMLSTTKLDVLRTFWGDSVVIDDHAGMTWMRQPHYYMGLYPYTYSAGLTASTAVSKRIFEEGLPIVEKWLDVLRAGGTKSPLELLKMVDIDMSTPEPVKIAVEHVGNLITELEELFR